MDELPAAMLTQGRAPDHLFGADELLYRRVPLVLWDDPGDAIGIEAIELPDMSVNRGRYSHPEWARLERAEFADWGVTGFAVKDVPSELLHLGRFRWKFAPSHQPLKRNYPHSEIRAFEDGRHVNAKGLLDPVVHLRWREQLRRKLIKVLMPHERREIRHVPPAGDAGARSGPA